MEQAFIINPQANLDSLKEALYEKVTQVNAMANCLLLASEELDGSLLFDAIWAITNHIEQIIDLLKANKIGLMGKE